MNVRLPVIRGVIDRRILANYRIDPAIAAQALPPPFRPKLVNGFAVGGICLIRLRDIRPRFLPAAFGLRSENAAHRFAVEWDSDHGVSQGVYIPRRDTSSRLNSLAGGTVFPGTHHHAEFTVHETADRLAVAVRSDDGATHVRVIGSVGRTLPPSSVFPSLEAASHFFEQGSLGYSATANEGKFDGLELYCEEWQVQALQVEQVESSFFDDESRFPRGAVEFDCALLMRDIQHEWHGRRELCCPAFATA